MQFPSRSLSRRKRDRWTVDAFEVYATNETAMIRQQPSCVKPLIRAGDYHSNFASKKPNSRKKPREFGVTSLS
jgi:hypothetical protein